MIQVPDEIKALLHQDTCKKNIRIHFPNDERSDICNGLIVKDSVSFTESLCSQNALKFGLCEASIFECETVGVGNIKGAVIEVSCEIYCESTVTGAEWRSDLEAYIYSIPYGTFTVNSCQRQADIIHRKIVAYGGNYLVKASIGKMESGKSIVAYANDPLYSADLLSYVIGNLDLNNISDSLFNATVIQRDINSGGSGIFYTWTYGNKSYRTIFSWNEDLWRFDRTTGSRPISDLNNLYRISGELINANNYSDEITALLTSYGAPQEVIRNILIDINTSIGFCAHNSAYYIKELPRIFYPYSGSRPTSIYGDTGVDMTLTRYFEVPIFEFAYPDYIEVERLHCDICPEYVLEMLTPTFSLFNGMNLQIAAVKNQNNSYIITHSGDYDNRNMLNSIVELMGMFGYFDRNNVFKLMNIKQQFALLPETTLYPSGTLYPEGVTGGEIIPNDYQSCWYDDEYTKPFGAIRCIYVDTNDNEIQLVYYLSGYSENTPLDQYKTYDISDNEIIKTYAFTQSQIENICETIASNIEGVTYMPVDFVGRGLPYVEAGDTFEVLTKLNDSITTIVLNRTLTGDQTLKDQYKSTGTEGGVM